MAVPGGSREPEFGVRVKRLSGETRLKWLGAVEGLKWNEE